MVKVVFVASIIACLLQSTAAATSNAACTPVSGTFKFVTGNYLKCSTPRRMDLGKAIVTTCGDYGTIYFNFVENTVHVVAPSTGNEDVRFNFHGACNEFGKQISHVGLSVLVPAPQGIFNTYPGMTKQCNLDGKGMAVVFYAYRISDAQLDQCLAHPVKPID